MALLTVTTLHLICDVDIFRGRRKLYYLRQVQLCLSGDEVSYLKRSEVTNNLLTVRGCS